MRFRIAGVAGELNAPPGRARGKRTQPNLVARQGQGSRHPRMAAGCNRLSLERCDLQINPEMLFEANPSLRRHLHGTRMLVPPQPSL